MHLGERSSRLIGKETADRAIWRGGRRLRRARVLPEPRPFASINAIFVEIEAGHLLSDAKAHHVVLRRDPERGQAGQSIWLDRVREI